MSKTTISLLAAVLLTMNGVSAQETEARKFDGAVDDIQKRLEASVQELNDLRKTITDEKLPMSRELRELESELVNLQQDFQQKTRAQNLASLELANAREEIKARHEEVKYLATLFGDYVSNYEPRLHIAEVQRYKPDLEAAKLAAENTTLSQADVFAAQSSFIGKSLERVFDLLGGARFDGQAVDNAGKVQKGTFVLVGPTAVFRSSDGSVVGTVESRLGSLEPTVTPFSMPEDRDAVTGLVTTGAGRIPVDPTMGNAQKVESTNETLIEHIKKGGPVMWPIFILAGAAFLVVIVKWLSMAFLRSPSRRGLAALIDAVSRNDKDAAVRAAKSVGGPSGEMLYAGALHIDEPRELVEEVMYEKVLSTRLRLQKWLPFVAISASSAPLLGLLGTVTGIMNTFKLITVFGTGDVETLSSGISEALITTEYGLIVAIPSLLLHAFLSRKAKGVVDHMEKSAVAFMNQLTKTPMYQPEPAAQAAPAQRPAASAASDADLVKRQVQEILRDIFGSRVRSHLDGEVAVTRTQSAGESGS